MNERELVQLINTIVAVASIPPSLILLTVVLKERKIVDVGKRNLSKALTLLFSGIALSALINAILSLTTLLSKFDVLNINNRYIHTVAPYRSLFINLFFLLSSWFIYLSRCEYKNGK
jgi:ABC-type Fe3+-siderophore transport system permease subunit